MVINISQNNKMTSYFNETDLMHSAYVAGAGMAGSYALFGSEDINLFGMSIPSFAASGLVIGTSNYIVQIINTKWPLVDDLPLSKAYKHDVGIAVVPLSTGLMTFGLMRGIQGASAPFWSNVGLGAGSELIGQYVMDFTESKKTSGVV